MIAWQQLGFSAKPVGLLNIEGAGARAAQRLPAAARAGGLTCSPSGLTARRLP